MAIICRQFPSKNGVGNSLWQEDGGRVHFQRIAGVKIRATDLISLFLNSFTGHPCFYHYKLWICGESIRLDIRIAPLKLHVESSCASKIDSGLQTKCLRPLLYLTGRILFNKLLLALAAARRAFTANARWASSAVVVLLFEGPVVDVSSSTTPHSHRDAAAMGTGFWW